jgi:hypothetical protein
LDVRWQWSGDPAALVDAACALELGADAVPEARSAAATQLQAEAEARARASAAARARAAEREEQRMLEAAAKDGKGLPLSPSTLQARRESWQGYMAATVQADPVLQAMLELEQFDNEEPPPTATPVSPGRYMRHLAGARDDVHYVTSAQGGGSKVHFDVSL